MTAEEYLKKEREYTEELHKVQALRPRAPSIVLEHMKVSITIEGILNFKNALDLSKQDAIKLRDFLNQIYPN